MEKALSLWQLFLVAVMSWLVMALGKQRERERKSRKRPIIAMMVTTTTTTEKRNGFLYPIYFLLHFVFFFLEHFVLLFLFFFSPFFGKWRREFQRCMG